MRAIVAIVILLLVLLLAGLIVYILADRAWSVIKARYELRRRAVLAAAMDRWLASEPEQRPDEFLRPRPPFDRALAVQLCLERLPASDERSRSRMLDWLENSGQVASWLRDLSARSTWIRASAAENLGILRIPQVLDALVRALGDPVFDVRMRAAKALGALGGAQARQALIATLSEENRWSVIRIADLLAEMGPVVVEELIDAIPTMGRASRLAALDVIAQVGNNDATPFLSAELDELDRDVRARAASALGQIGDERAIPGLVNALHDPEWPVRAMAAKALGRLNARAAGSELAASLRDREWWVRANAAEALAQLGPDGLDVLTLMLDDQDAFARDSALAALEASGELTRQLMPLTSSDAGSRQDAIRLLKVLTSRVSGHRLAAIRDLQRDEQLRSAIDSVLSRANAREEAVS